MAIRYKKIYAKPAAVFTELEGVLLDVGCQVTIQAMIQIFQERNVEITDVDAASKPDKLVGHDVTCKKTHLRHVLMDVVAKKWEAVNGAAPTEWDVEALFKEYPRCMEEHLKRAKAAPGSVEAITDLQSQGIKCSVASNFDSSTMDAWQRVAHANGFELDGCMSCSDVPNPGKDGFSCVLPQPWRCHAMAARLGIYPMSTTIRVSATPYGVEEGLNAGMWTVAVSTTGLAEPFEGPGETDDHRVNRVNESFYRLGCHYVIDGVWDLPKTVEKIQARMEAGETP